MGIKRRVLSIRRNGECETSGDQSVKICMEFPRPVSLSLLSPSTPYYIYLVAALISFERVGRDGDGSGEINVGALPFEPGTAAESGLSPVMSGDWK